MPFLKPITDKPWIAIAVFFLFFIAALAVTVAIAVKNQPADVRLETGGH
jgi:hypothetical protein